MIGRAPVYIQPNGSVSVESRKAQAAVFTAQATNSTATITVGKALQLVLNVTVLPEGVLYVRGVLGSGRTVPLVPVDLATGERVTWLTRPGAYLFDVPAFATVEFELRLSRTGYTATATAWLLDEPLPHPQVPTTPPVPRKIVAQKAATSVIGEYEMPRALSTTGILYGRRDSPLRRSTDFGATWTSLHDFTPAIPQAVVATESGRVVVCLDTGKVMTSDTAEANFTQTLDMGAAPVHPMLFGATAYRDKVLLSGYAAKTDETSRYVFMSDDAGVTWATIFDAVAQGHTAPLYHVHDARYDPYEDLVWIAVGDGLQSMIYYSRDRTTWHAAGELGEFGMQVTQVIPLPECVLFISDARLVGVWRYDRPPGGTRFGDALHFVQALVLAEAWGKAGETEVPIASTAAIDYANGSAYFGWAIIGNAQAGGSGSLLRYAPIYGTRDGREFFIVWQLDEAQAAAGEEGVFGVFGPDTNGNIVAHIDGPGTPRAYTVRLNTSMWQSR